MDIDVRLESLDPVGVPFKVDTLKVKLEPIDSRRADRLYLHIGKCVYRVDREGCIIDRVIPHEKECASYLETKDKVYAFQYNSCIHESVFYTVSLHKSCKGAYDAMRKHVLGGYVRWYDERIMYGKKHSVDFGVDEDWRVFVMEIEE